MNSKPAPANHPWRKMAIGRRQTEEDYTVQEREEAEDRLEQQWDRELDKQSESYGGMEW